MTDAGATLYELRDVERRYLKGSAEVAALKDVDLDVSAQMDKVCDGIRFRSDLWPLQS